MAVGFFYQVLAQARPLPPHLRDTYLRHVADALAASKSRERHRRDAGAVDTDRGLAGELPERRRAATTAAARAVATAAVEPAATAEGAPTAATATAAADVGGGR
jgi:hypothetical protein